MDTEPFLAAACELLAVRSTGDRPGDLHKALDFVVDFAGPGFTVERFESGGKPSALMYRGAHRPRFRIILNAHLDVVPAPAAPYYQALKEFLQNPTGPTRGPGAAQAENDLVQDPDQAAEQSRSVADQR